MVGKYLKYPVLILYAIALMLLFYTGYFSRLLKLPEGCDEFGYLNIAKAVSHGSLFKNHALRPFDGGLLEYLKHSSYDYGSYEYMISPHAYYLHTKFKIINQYPPGTGILLSPLPFEKRKTAAPAVFALSLILFLILAFIIKSGEVSFLEINLVAVIAFLFFITSYIPFSFSNYNIVNGVAPTFGMLIAAGYLLDKKPGMTIALLGTSVMFRVANVILFVPLLLVYLWKGFRIGEYFSKETPLRAVKATIFFLAGGGGFYLLYIGALLGDPFSQTYPQEYVKLGLVSFKNIIWNIGYYISPTNRWFVFHVFILGLMVLMRVYKEMPTKWIVFSLVISIYNYGFYIGHWFYAEYYPYASGMIMAGILLSYTEEYLRKTAGFRRIVNYAGVIIIFAAVIFSIVRFPRQDAHKFFYDQIKAYNDCFSGYDVVWSEFRSGTVEYTTGKAAFRFQWGPRKTRDKVMSWLHEHGYRQAIWVSDMEKGFLDTVDVEKELKSIPVDYTVKTCPAFGTVIEVR